MESMPLAVGQALLDLSVASAAQFGGVRDVYSDAACSDAGKEEAVSGVDGVDLGLVFDYLLGEELAFERDLAERHCLVDARLRNGLVFKADEHMNVSCDAQEATPDTLIDLIGKTQQVTKSAAVVLKACRTVMDTRTKKEHIDKWGGIHAITEAVYDCADLAQRILDAGLAMENMCAKPATSRQMILIDDLRRSLDMDDGDVEATVDPDTGEID